MRLQFEKALRVVALSSEKEVEREFAKCAETLRGVSANWQDRVNAMNRIASLVLST
jgi:hypothetical protein